MEAAEQKVESVALYARVIRADGTDEGERCVAYWHRNPLKRLWARYVRGIRGRVDPKTINIGD